MFDEIACPVLDQVIHFHGLDITIRRLDLIHPQISGNKFFKLKYNLITAKQQGYSKVVTFGGAFSNHIAATAYAAQRFGFQSVGIIRGEELKNRPLNPTLQTAHDLGMQLHFVSREEYRLKDNKDYLANLNTQFPDHYLIPEGGTNLLAIEGCQEILNTQDSQYDVICCAVGTGGTMTGLIEASHTHQQVWGFSALKGDFLTTEVSQLTAKTNWYIMDDYCFGGYAKTSAELFAFMAWFEQQYDIPLEQIYTAKMLFGIQNLILNKKITKQMKLLVIHSGGLQGKSLP
jgi:1-aminocyclopropane-1-carboxylate deaminase